jgi:hypothetical protein
MCCNHSIKIGLSVREQLGKFTVDFTFRNAEWQNIQQVQKIFHMLRSVLCDSATKFRPCDRTDAYFSFSELSKLFSISGGRLRIR